MMTITFNQTILTIENNVSLSELLAQQKLEDGNFAIALNARFVPKHNYQNVLLKQDDVIEMIKPMQGG
jgi:thiamine biosynthesis protein ThiS